jgi:hypothetical protein
MGLTSFQLELVFAMGPDSSSQDSWVMAEGEGLVGAVERLLLVLGAGIAVAALYYGDETPSGPGHACWVVAGV